MCEGFQGTDSGVKQKNASVIQVLYPMQYPVKQAVSSLAAVFAYKINLPVN